MDVAHSVMGDALRDIGGYQGRGDGEFMRWLARIVENKLRKRARGMRHGDRNPAKQIEIQPARTEVAGFEPRAPDPTPSMEMGAREERSRLKETLAQLPEREQRLIRLRKLEGLSWPEVVRRSDEPSVKAAQSAYARAMSKLAKALGGTDS